MKNASQIVFLIDLDGVNDDHVQRPRAATLTSTTATNVDCEILTNSILNQICLRFLSYFAAQNCIVNSITPNDNDVVVDKSTLVKWGYKFYRSRSVRPIRQRYQFRDVDVQSLRQFAVDLDCQLHRATDSSEDQLVASLTLERTIRELICDFPWDSPYISSPVKRSSSYTRQGDRSSTVDNYVVLLTKLPTSADELRAFIGCPLVDDVQSSTWPDIKGILDCFAPSNVRQLMCNVAKIRLLWLDVLPFSYKTCEELQSGEQVKHSFELIHEALTIIGGGIVPLGTVLLHDTLQDGFEKSGATCHRFHFPESYRLRIPFASVLAVYSSYGEIPSSSNEHRCDTIIDIPSSSRHHLQLLPLFKKIICPNECDGSATDACVCGSKPRSLKAIGTIKLSDMRSNLAVDSKVYICCPSNLDSDVCFQDLLDDLATDSKVLVFSTETSLLGLLVPANDDSCLAILYMLLGGSQSSMDFTNVTIAKVILKLMTPWKVPGSSEKHGDGSADFLNRWLQGENAVPCNLKKGEEELIRKLQKSNQSSVNSNYRDGCHRRSPRFEKGYSRIASHRPLKTAVSKSLIFSHDRTNHCREQMPHNKANGDHKHLIKDFTNEEALLIYLQTKYDAAVQNDKTVTEVAHDIVLTVKGHYRKLPKEDQIKIFSAFLGKNILKSSKDLSSKHCNTTETSKKTRIQETYLQVAIRLEMLLTLSKGGVDDKNLVNEITLLLRSLSFVAGPPVLSRFLHDTLITNYYHCLRNSVTEICEELNQPLPDSDTDTGGVADGDSPSPTPSLSSLISDNQSNVPFETTDATSTSSLFSQWSVASIISSNEGQSIKHKNKRELVRHPSFLEASRKRQIVVPGIKLAQPLNNNDNNHKERHRRHHHEQKNKHHGRSRTAPVGFVATIKHLTPPKRQKVATPKGRHVLKTKKVSETPINKQVSHVTLARQRSKRKLMSDEEVDKDCEHIVAETPEKLWGESSFRRSPRQHASSLERQASFYSSDSQSRNLAKAESQMNFERANQYDLCDVTHNDTSDFTLLDEVSSHHRNSSSIIAEENNATSPVMFVTPKSKARVKRHLNLGSLKSPVEKVKPNSECLTNRYQSARHQLFKNDKVRLTGQDQTGSPEIHIENDNRECVILESEKDNLQNCQATTESKEVENVRNYDLIIERKENDFENSDNSEEKQCDEVESNIEDLQICESPENKEQEYPQTFELIELQTEDHHSCELIKSDDRESIERNENDFQKSEIVEELICDTILSNTEDQQICESNKSKEPTEFLNCKLIVETEEDDLKRCETIETNNDDQLKCDVIVRSDENLLKCSFVEIKENDSLLYQDDFGNLSLTSIINVDHYEDVVTTETTNGFQSEIECSSPIDDSNDNHNEHDITCIISSPLRNGVDSPTECSVTHSMPFPKGPLSNDGFSRSSSPEIPVFVYNVDFDNHESSVDYEGSMWSDDDHDQELEDAVQPEPTANQPKNGSTDTLLNHTASNNVFEEACNNVINENINADDDLKNDYEPNAKRRRLEQKNTDPQQMNFTKISLINNTDQCKSLSPTAQHVSNSPILASISMTKSSDQ